MNLKRLSFISMIMLAILFCRVVSAQSITGLTVLVNFSDTSPEIGTISGRKFHSLLNQVDYVDGSYVNGSLRDYYLDNSGGAVDLSSIVLIVDLPKTRISYVGSQPRSDDFGSVSARDPHTGFTNQVAGVTGGAFADLITDIRCRLIGGCTSIGVSYKEYDMSTNDFVVKSAPFDFSRLSTTESIFSLDWLDVAANTGGGVPNPSVIPHFAFVQVLVPGSASTQGKGFWPRSLPFTDTSIPGQVGFSLGRVALIPIPEIGNPSLGTIAHESGHVLYGFKDLYDTQRESLNFKSTSSGFVTINDIWDGEAWYDSQGIGKYSLMGSVRDAERNPPLINAPNRELAGWESPLDLIDAGEGEVYTLDWHADGSDNRRARSFKYCKPHSNVSECFYIEYRWNNLTRAHHTSGSLRTMYSPDDGLLVWHAENYANPFDFGVNQRKEGTAGLHFGVSLVQADGLSELESSCSSSCSVSGDLFKSGLNDELNDFTTPNSRWWSGEHSGLAIRNVSSVGSVMTFEIGERPKRDLVFDLDWGRYEVRFVSNGMRVNKDNYEFPVGSKVRVQVRDRYGESYRVTSSATNELFEGVDFTGVNEFDLAVTFEPNIIKIDSGLSTTRPLNVDLQLGNGLTLYYMGEGGGKSIARSIRSNQDNAILPEAVRYAGVEHYEFFVKARPGVRFKKWIVDYKDGTEGERGYDSSIWIHEPSLNRDASGVNSPITISVESERIPGLLCASDSVEQWRWDGVYKELGTFVRYGDRVYQSHLPRAHAFHNRQDFYSLSVADQIAFNSNPDLVPSDYPDVWSNVAICGEYTIDCGAIPQWNHSDSYVKGDQVQYNGDAWRVEHTSVKMGLGMSPVVPISDSIPGGFSALIQGFRRTIKTASDPQFDLGVASVAGAIPVEPHWSLLGHCNSDDNVYRAFIGADEAVDSVTIKNPNYSGGRWKLEKGYLSPSSYLANYAPLEIEVKLRAGFVLESIQLDGINVVASFIESSSAYIFIVDWNALPRHAHFIEIRAKKT